MNRGLGLAILVVLLSLALALPAGASPPQDAVTIFTNISFEFPYIGTFTVVEGAEELGCSSGTFVDHPAGFLPPSKGNVAKIFTCNTDGSGTFTVNFQPSAYKPGPGTANGHWNITEATGDFVGLHGQGAFSVDVVFENGNLVSGEETIKGFLHYDP